MQDRTMNILIVEDEPLAAAQLAALVAQIRPQSTVVALCDTIETTVEWIRTHDAPDLAFFDVQLGDGLSFEVFKQVEFATPVIFTTAFVDYAIDAFKVNSIDYILKPLEKKALEQAILKYEKLNTVVSPPIDIDLISAMMLKMQTRTYKERFLVKIGTHLRTVVSDDILYVYSFQKGTYLKSRDGKTYVLDQTVEQVAQVVDPKHFFRINRKYLVHFNALLDVHIYSNSRLKLDIKHAEEDDFLVSREKVKCFKAWLDGA